MSANTPYKISNLAVITAFTANNRFVVYASNGSANDVFTITANTLFSSNVFSLLPTYADQDAANSGGLDEGQLYKTSNGEIRIVI